ncbi:MAG: ATP-binding protein [Planctomycetota bacterium]
MIDRDLVPRLAHAAAQFPVVTLTGPRQSGKSTLCRSAFDQHEYVSLEAPDVRAFAADDPRAFLASLPAGAVLDEVQRAPDLPSYLQGLVDEDPTPGRWILTGSQNLAVIESVNQSLAGRSAVLHLLPLSWNEVLRFERHGTHVDEAMFTGGYPRIYDRRLDPSDWLGSYVATYVERDVRSMTGVGDLVAFQRFVELCAGRTGQLLNYSALAADCGISQPTAKSWFSVLETSFLAFRLPSLQLSVRKRIVKMPKIHFHDVGLACWLLGIREPAQLRSHPLRGALFESWVVSEIQKHRAHSGERRGLSFYRDSTGAEVDAVVEHEGRLVLVEAKSAATPSRNLFDGTARVRERLESAGHECEVVVVYAGEQDQARDAGRLVPWNRLHDEAWL